MFKIDDKDTLLKEKKLRIEEKERKEREKAEKKEKLVGRMFKDFC